MYKLLNYSSAISREGDHYVIRPPLDPSSANTWLLQVTELDAAELGSLEALNVDHLNALPWADAPYTDAGYIVGESFYEYLDVVGALIETGIGYAAAQCGYAEGGREGVRVPATRPGLYELRCSSGGLADLEELAGLLPKIHQQGVLDAWTSSGCLHWASAHALSSISVALDVLGVIVDLEPFQSDIANSTAKLLRAMTEKATASMADPVALSVGVVVETIKDSLGNLGKTYLEAAGKSATMTAVKWATIVLKVLDSASHLGTALHKVVGGLLLETPMERAFIIVNADCVFDQQPPVLEVRCPSGADSRGMIISWNGSDNCTQEQGLLYQSRLSNSDAGWSGWASQTERTYSDLSNGVYSFCVRAKDSAGNISADACCAVHVNIDPCADDGEAPTASITCTSPAADGSLAVSWSGVDNCTPTEDLRFASRLNSSGVGSSWTAFDRPPGSAHFGAGELGPGAHMYCVKAQDAAGNVSVERCCSVTIEECKNEPRIWTDKTAYCIGESSRIYFSVSAPSLVDVWVTYESEASISLVNGQYFDAAGTYYMDKTVGEPSGLKTLHIAATACGSTRYESTAVTAEECGGCPPPNGYVNFRGRVVEMLPVISFMHYRVQVEAVLAGVDFGRCYAEVNVWHGDHDSGWCDPSVAVGSDVEVSGLYRGDVNRNDVYLVDVGDYITDDL